MGSLKIEIETDLKKSEFFIIKFLSRENNDGRK